MKLRPDGTSSVVLACIGRGGPEKAHCNRLSLLSKKGKPSSLDEVEENMDQWKS